MFFDAAFSSQGAVSWLGELLPIMKLPIKSWHCIRYWILSFLLLVFDGIFSSAEQYVRRTRRTLMLDGQMDRCECTITDNDDGEIQFSCVLSQEGIVCRNYRWIVRGNCRVDCAKFSMRCRPFLASKLNWNSGTVIPVGSSNSCARSILECLMSYFCPRFWLLTVPKVNAGYREYRFYSAPGRGRSSRNLLHDWGV